MVASTIGSFLLAFIPFVKTLESNIMSRSLVFNKILYKHMGNKSKNMKKVRQRLNIKEKKYEKQK